MDLTVAGKEAPCHAVSVGEVNVHIAFDGADCDVAKEFLCVELGLADADNARLTSSLWIDFLIAMLYSTYHKTSESYTFTSQSPELCTGG